MSQFNQLSVLVETVVNNMALEQISTCQFLSLPYSFIYYPADGQLIYYVCSSIETVLPHYDNYLKIIN
jgi:hypothetical protein